MKNILVGLMSCFLLFGCTNIQRTSLDKASEGYPKEVAIEEDCVVIQQGIIENGENEWLDFFERTNNGQKATIRMVEYGIYIDDIETFQVVDIEYDGKVYQMSYYSEGSLATREYKYLLMDEIYESGQRYYYLDNNQETFEEAMKKGLSSTWEFVNSFKILFTQKV